MPRRSRTIASRCPSTKAGSRRNLAPSVSLALALVSLGSCEQTETCGQAATLGEKRAALYGASPEPGRIPLTSAQRASLVSVVPRLGPAGNFCTGSVIAGGWVLTAAHCNLGGGMIVGEGPSLRAPVRSHVTSEVFTHPSLDLALAHVPTLAANTLEPFAVRATALTAAFRGAVVQLAGFGEHEAQEFGELGFLAAQIASVDERELTTDGAGRSGACGGDSGGPLLLVGRNGRPELAGVLSSGASSCVGRDRYVRADVAFPWIAEHIGARESHVNGCGALSAVGECQAGEALWCEQNKPQTETCSDGQVCGWSVGRKGYRCIEAENDPCQGISAQGECQFDKALHCEQGAPIAVECAACGQSCGRDPYSGNVACLTAPRGTSEPSAVTTVKALMSRP